jgi:hypothetical protein
MVFWILPPSVAVFQQNMTLYIVLYLLQTTIRRNFMVIFILYFFTDRLEPLRKLSVVFSQPCEFPPDFAPLARLRAPPGLWRAIRPTLAATRLPEGTYVIITPLSTNSNAKHASQSPSAPCRSPPADQEAGRPADFLAGQGAWGILYIALSYG